MDIEIQLGGAEWGERLLIFCSAPKCSFIFVIFPSFGVDVCINYNILFCYHHPVDFFVIFISLIVLLLLLFYILCYNTTLSSSI